MASEIMGMITRDGSSGYKAEKGRYHLYVSHGCPFAHRSTIVRVLKGLEDVITADFVDYNFNRETGWKFSPHVDDCTQDTVNGKQYLKEVYLMSHPNYEGKISVPVLFDKTTKKIVSNDSASILRMLNSEFNEFSATPEQASLDLYPADKQKQIDELNEWIAPGIVTKVYKVKATLDQSQEKYETQVGELFDALQKVEDILSKSRFLTGDKLTEADIRLYVTLVRFDAVYYRLFSCSKKPLVSYQNIWPYTRDIYQTGKVSSTTNMKHIKGLYYSGKTVVPVGPELNFNEKHGREMLLKA